MLTYCMLMLINFNIRYIIDANVLYANILSSLNNYAGGRYFICCASLYLLFFFFNNIFALILYLSFCVNLFCNLLLTVIFYLNSFVESNSFCLKRCTACPLCITNKTPSLFETHIYLLLAAEFGESLQVNATSRK